MTRSQKKCLLFSFGLHGLLLVILLAGAGFGSRPHETDLQLLNMIPANIVDRAGSGGGTRVVNLSAQAPAQPRAQQRARAQAQPQPQPARAEQVERAPAPTPRQPREIRRPQPDETDEVGLEPAPKRHKRSSRHEIKPTFTEANATTRTKRVETSQSSESSARAEARTEARAEARRLKELQDSLNDLATGVQSSGSPNTIVDAEGIGGGAAFASYRDVVFSAYYHAWITPDNATSRLSSADAKVIIRRDGMILSAEVVRPSGDRALDNSVEQALRRVTQLAPFPASTRDTQRTFVIRFSLEAKEMTG